MVTAKLSVVQEKGQVTIPAEVCRRWGLQKGTLVAFEETEEGVLLRPQKVVAMDVLDRPGKVLAERGIDLEELLASIGATCWPIGNGERRPPVCIRLVPYFR